MTPDLIGDTYFSRKMRVPPPVEESIALHRDPRRAMLADLGPKHYNHM